MHDYTRTSLFIDGQWVAADGRDAIEVIDPSTEEAIGCVPNGTVGDVDRAVAAARRAFDPLITVDERRSRVAAVIAAMEKRLPDIAETITRELGAPLRISQSIQTQVPLAVARGFADVLDSFEFEERVGNSLVVREPYGVVGAITPWNYPLYQVVAKVLPNIAAGCTVVLKPSNEAPLSVFEFIEAVEDAGLPAGVVNLASGSGRVIGERIAAHPDVDFVSFTGSTGVGQRVAELAAQSVKKIALELGGKSANVIVDAWLTGWDENFTAALAARGWLGMTVPVEYGGHGRSFIERFVVTEELLAAGAPVAAHWIADRQIVPSLLKYGTEHQKSEFLPRIVKGECFFGIGMSEPDSGSDLASVRTKAIRVDGGWSLTGTKVWTSGAHRAHAFIVLARTAPVDPQNRHGGLSQFIVNLRGPGVDVRPIVSMNGAHHFNEVVLDEAFVPDDMVFGEIGQGWQQVTSELSFERSGPERFLSTFVLLAASADHMASQAIAGDSRLGQLVARIAGLHQMSIAVAGALERHEPADVPAAVVKVLGTTTEGDIADFADLLTGDEDEVDSEFAQLVSAAADQRPGFTLRGGTNEVLRGVVARGFGLR